MRKLTLPSSLLALAGLLATACSGSDNVRVIGNRDNGATIELAVGERVRFELESTIQRNWKRNVVTEPFVLVEKEERVDETKTSTLSVSEFEGTGGGEQKLVFWELPYNTAYTPQSSFPSMTFTVKVNGPSREDEIFALYKGFTPVGGFGTSRESGRPIRELALFPSDLIAGVDGHLYVASEERIWQIDTKSRTGTIFIDKTRTSGPLPSGAVVTALDQRGTADWMLGLREGTTNTVGWLRADGTWTAVHSWDSPRSIHRVRIAPDGSGWAAVDRVGAVSQMQQSSSHPRRTCESGSCGDGAPDAIEFTPDGTLLVRGYIANATPWILVGRDRNDAPLLFTSKAPDGLLRLDAGAPAPTPLFNVLGVPGVTPTERVYRHTDFYPSMPEMTIGTGSSKYTWPAQKAAVAQTSDGAYWASGVTTVQEPPDYKGYNQGRGLYIHE